MIRKFFSQIDRSLDKVIDKTPDAKTAFVPLQALLLFIIGILVFMSGPKYLITGFVVVGVASVEMLLFISLIGEWFFLLLVICECLGLAFLVADVIFFVQHGFASLTVLFAAFGLWYVAFGTFGIFLLNEAVKNWLFLAIAHIILLTGASFVGAFTSPSDNWITLPLPFITIALTFVFMLRCILQHWSKASK